MTVICTLNQSKSIERFRFQDMYKFWNHFFIGEGLNGYFRFHYTVYKGIFSQLRKWGASNAAMKGGGAQGKAKEQKENV